MKCGSRAPAHNASLKGVLRTIIVQDLTLTAVLAVDFNARVYVKLQQNHWNMKYGSRAPEQLLCKDCHSQLSQLQTLMIGSTQNYDTVTGA